MSCIELWEEQGSQVIKIKMATRKSRNICSNLKLMPFTTEVNFFKFNGWPLPMFDKPQRVGSRRNDVKFSLQKNTVSVNDAYTSLPVSSSANTLSVFFSSQWHSKLSLHQEKVYNRGTIFLTFLLCLGHVYSYQCGLLQRDILLYVIRNCLIKFTHIPVLHFCQFQLLE